MGSLIAIIVIIAIIAITPIIAIIPIIGTSVDAENAVLCAENAKKQHTTIKLHRLVRCFGIARSDTHPGGLFPQVGPDRRTSSRYSSLVGFEGHFRA